MKRKSVNVGAPLEKYILKKDDDKGVHVNVYIFIWRTISSKIILHLVVKGSFSAKRIIYQEIKWPILQNLSQENHPSRYKLASSAEFKPREWSI